MREENRTLQLKATRDALTNLANRSYLNEYIEEAFDKAYLRQEVIGVELLDIDCFKQYNDTYGHLEGDKCLKAISKILLSLENESVFCARYGGDEFIIIYYNLNEQEIKSIVETIHNRVEEARIEHKASLCKDIVSVSQGVFYKIPTSNNRVWDFNSMADAALYEVKRQGKNHYLIWNNFSDQIEIERKK